MNFWMLQEPNKRIAMAAAGSSGLAGLARRGLANTPPPSLDLPSGKPAVRRMPDGISPRDDLG